MLRLNSFPSDDLLKLVAVCGVALYSCKGLFSSVFDDALINGQRIVGSTTGCIPLFLFLSQIGILYIFSPKSGFTNEKVLTGLPLITASGT